MGQAGVDLPDPLEKPPLGPAPSADDLLAQLAGDEIDRLLSDGEVEKSEGAAAVEEPPAAPPIPELPPVAETSAAVTSEPPTAAQVDDQTAKQLDELFEQLTADAPVSNVPPPQMPRYIAPAPRPAAAAKPSTPPPIDPVLSQQLDDLYAALNAPLPTDQPAAVPAAALAPVAVPAAVPEPVATAAAASDPKLNQQLDDLFNQLTAAPAEPEKKEPAAAAPMPEAVPAAEAVDPAEQTSELERQVLAAEGLGEKEDALEEAAGEEEGDGVPLLLRILEWINFPLQHCSEGVREAIGKVAVMTLMNAVGLLIYVLVIRRH